MLPVCGQSKCNLCFLHCWTSAHDGCTCVQDAREYFQYLLDVMSRAERTSMQRLGQPDQPATADAFKFELEDRIQCLESGKLSYKRSLTNVLAMDIPVDAATNKDELENFQVCKEWLSFATVLKVCYSQSKDSSCSTVKYHAQHMQVSQPNYIRCCNQTPAVPWCCNRIKNIRCLKTPRVLCRSGRQSVQS